MSRAAPLPCLSLLLVLCAASRPAAAAPELPIYRCTDTRGQLTLSDSPCPSGQRQETRIMQRPQDPPPRAVAPASSSPPRPLPAATTQIIVRTPMQPMYECVTSEGHRYTSDNDDGNPRWVPYGVAYPAWPRVGSSASVSGSVSVGNGHLSFESGDRRPPHPPGGHPPGPGPVILPGGTWVRDTCHPLPQQEVCARLSDRRYEILRRYGSAMSSERRALDLEQRGIDARIANDCRNP